jgi:hypothetical protein
MEPTVSEETWIAWRLRICPALTELQFGNFGRYNSKEELDQFEQWLNTPWQPKGAQR